VLTALGFTALVVGASVVLALILSYAGQGGVAAGQAQQLARQGQGAAALARYEASLKRRPGHAQALVGRAELLLEQNQAGTALADLNRAILSIPHVSNFPDPLLTQAYVQRGRARELLGDRTGALEDWERASRANPNQPEPYVLRGRAELDAGHYYQGQALLTRAVKIASFYLDQTQSRQDKNGTAGLLNVRGMAYTLLDQPQRALRDLEAALAIDPRAWAVHYNLAAAYLALGHRDQALAALTEAVRLYPATAGAARRNTIFQPLHDDPEFERILARAA
jgi:tetratricopeptide (TPR) repeat protein